MIVSLEKASDCSCVARIQAGLFGTHHPPGPPENLIYPKSESSRFFLHLLL